MGSEIHFSMEQNYPGISQKGFYSADEIPSDIIYAKKLSMETFLHNINLYHNYTMREDFIFINNFYLL